MYAVRSTLASTAVGCILLDRLRGDFGQQEPIFDSAVCARECPVRAGMWVRGQTVRYIGSKTGTLPFLSNLVRRKAPTARSLCDPFAGTCTVGRHFKREGFAITTGDVLRLSYVLQLATIRLNRAPSFKQLYRMGAVRPLADCARAEAVLRHLQKLPGREGYLTKYFSPAGKAGRRFFTVENAMQADAARTEIARWSQAGLISESEEAYLLASLLEAMDKVASTAGTYFAHLKAFTRKAVQPIAFAPPPIISNGYENVCRMEDARELAKSCKADILYLDPPYNERDYAGYYHLLETIALGQHPTPGGKSGAPSPPRHRRSDFCSPARAAKALEDVVSRARARNIVVHYTNDGLINHRTILAMLRDRGPTSFQDVQVRGYSATRQVGLAFTTHRIYWCSSACGDI